MSKGSFGKQGAKGRRRRESRNRRYKRGAWDFFTEVFIHSMNKGQLPAAVLGLVAIVLALKYPSEEVPQVFGELLDFYRNWNRLGWVLFVGTVVLWFLHTRKLRRQFSKEFDRIGKEKSRLQEEIARKTLKSSNR